MKDENLTIKNLMDTVATLQEQIKTLQAQMQNASPQTPTPQVMDVKVHWSLDEGFSLFRFVFGDYKYVFEYDLGTCEIEVSEGCTAPDEARLLLDESLIFSRWLESKVTELIDTIDAALANVKFNVDIRSMLDECNESI